MAYGEILRQRLLDRPRQGCINLHCSLLPRWRGAAPVERAILAGDLRTGVCLMQVAEGLDTGDIHEVATVDISEDDTLESLRMRLVELGTSMVLHSLREGLSQPSPQVGEPVHAAKIDPAELRLDWQQPAVQIARVVRLGGAWTTFRGRRMKIWRASVVDRDDLAPGVIDGTIVGTSAGSIELVELQPEGRSRVAAEDWRNGARPAPGEQVGQ